MPCYSRAAGQALSNFIAVPKQIRVAVPNDFKRHATAGLTSSQLLNLVRHSMAQHLKQAFDNLLQDIFMHIHTIRVFIFYFTINTKIKNLF